MIPLFRRLIWKELYDLARQPLVLLGVIALPLYLLWASTGFFDEDSPNRVVVVPFSDGFGTECVKENLTDLDKIDFVFHEGGTDINPLLAEHNARLGLLFEDCTRAIFVERSYLAFERRTNSDLALRIQAALKDSDPRLNLVVSGLSSARRSNDPQTNVPVIVGETDQMFVPKMLTLLTILLSTVLGCRSMIREREARTLPLLVSLSHSSLFLVALSKAVFLMLLCLAILCVLLLALPHMFGLAIKPGTAGVISAYCLAILPSASVGILLGILGRSIIESYLMVSAYIIATLVLTGFVSPVDQQVGTAATIAQVFFPLTYLRPIMEGWLFYGDPATWRSFQLAVLGVHAIATLALLYVMTRKRDIVS